MQGQPYLDQVVQELYCILNIGFAVSTEPEHGIKHLTEKDDEALTSHLHISTTQHHGATALA